MDGYGFFAKITKLKRPPSPLHFQIPEFVICAANCAQSLDVANGAGDSVGCGSHGEGAATCGSFDSADETNKIDRCLFERG